MKGVSKNVNFKIKVLSTILNKRRIWFMNTEAKKGIVVMDEDSKKFYGLFGYVVVHIGASKENQANAMGKRVRQLYEENHKQELMLCMITNSNYETLSTQEDKTDETLGYSIQLQLLWANIDFKNLGLRIVATLETYPEQEKMLKAVTGYSYQELVDMLPYYEFDYDQLGAEYDNFEKKFDYDELIQRLKEELIK